MALVADRANRSRICRVKVAAKGEIALLLCESLIHVVVEEGVFSGETVLEAPEGMAELAREQAGPESSEQKCSAF
jgi:hypothetical protein